MLELRNLSVAYGKVEALKNVSVTVEKGEIISIIGANGAGKSTMMKAISGLLRPVGGEILYEGKALPANVGKIAASGITHVPEGRRVFPSLTVRENLVLGGYLRPWKEINEGIEDVFALFPRLKEREKQRAGTLSGGEQQMLAIGRGIMSRPAVMLFDEPSLGLAPIIVNEIFDFFPRFNRERGTTMIIVEQNAKMALKISGRSYVLETGEIKKEGLSADLQKDEDVVKAYLAGGM